MQSVCVATTVRVGNHLLTAEEAAAGQPQRLPFADEDGAPVDPDTVLLALTAATGETRTFAYPDVGPDDSGVLTRQEEGRFYVDWTPLDPEDGLWRWALVGAMSLGTAQSDQDVFFVRRPIAPGP
jgi:hypothetical protein